MLIDYGFILTLAASAVLAVAYSVFATRWLSPRVRPVVPQFKWWWVAVVSAVITVGLGVAGVPLHVLPLVAALTPLLVLSAGVDAFTRRIPNAYTVQAIALTLLSVVWLLTSLDTTENWWLSAAWSTAIGGVTFIALLALNIGSRGGFGMGDVKLGSVMAIALALYVTSAWPDSAHVAFSAPLVVVMLVMAWLTLSFISGGIVVAVRAVRGLGGGFPFGPCLVVAWFVAIALTQPLAGMAAALV